MPPISPLAPDAFPDLPAVAGVRAAAKACGVRYATGRLDVTLIELAPHSSVAGVFTRSLTASAPVEWCREALAMTGGRGRAILVNAGNANAFTGKRGQETASAEVRATAKALGCGNHDVLLASTGVIGEPMPAERITRHLEGLADELAAGGWEAAAQAIMTTDTFPKGAWATAEIDGTTVTLAGIAKGSGMIQPDMATMLAFAFTDADIAPEALQTLLREVNEQTFNCITVDGDTSTSDTLLLAATGKAGNAAIIEADDPRLADFRRALTEVMTDLAQQVVRDGEGAQKFVTIRVRGAASDPAAKRIGLAIGNSPLVKTAIAGEDANWGRIVMAVGKAGERADRDRLSIAIGGIEIARNGEAVAAYDETPVAQHMQGREIEIDVDVGVGGGQATVWTCDLTHGYIDINADYRS
ncbi:bifunctional glutamate N-acetyltransferase/amino-acid acetyltransferase ArgJ [Rhodovibrio salinarum]|uniref:Arginine biosynthesis bifunctional protein ArgJ n=1 Tax=Rhodovibrio salinarum TaxID=1087 RepID=A0A934QHX5_9PROT|nr:bifunctional glutamate N-acetyltransferase/amino-acid acetyltransferase ArgJ [Rhodovibrio salinarum]MBK1697119.1 bifunctional ornithine acetyltransferase/N-acetylglutamate synthase [Rhodovibrio salinarum]